MSDDPALTDSAAQDTIHQFTQAEAARRGYLAALGVELYLSRQPLPYSAPAWLTEWESLAMPGEEPVLATAETDASPQVPAVANAASAQGRAPENSTRPPAGLSDEEAYFGSAPPGPPPGMASQAAPRRDASLAANLANVARSVLGGGSVSATPGNAAAPEVATRPPLFEDPGLPIPTLRGLRPEPTETAEATPPADTGLLRACLATFEWPGYLRVIIEMEDPDAPSLSAREHALWSDIALALAGRELAASAQSLRLFRFPPDRRLTQLQTPQAVREAVEGFLVAHQDRMAASAQLVFAGPALARAFQSSTDDQATTGVDATLQAPLHFTFAGREMILLPSLRQLLSDWRLKPVVWQTLRPFRHDAVRVGGMAVAGAPV